MKVESPHVLRITMRVPIAHPAGKQLDAGQDKIRLTIVDDLLPRKIASELQTALWLVLTNAWVIQLDLLNPFLDIVVLLGRLNDPLWLGGINPDEHESATNDVFGSNAEFDPTD